VLAMLAVLRVALLLPSLFYAAGSLVATSLGLSSTYRDYGMPGGAFSSR
jgi:hypothetical protein